MRALQSCPTGAHGQVMRLGQNPRLMYFLLAAAVVTLDQLTKSLVVHTIPLYSYVTVVPGFFRVSHVLNRGAAFSLFADSPFRYTTAALALFSLVVLAVVAAVLWRWTGGISRTGVGLALIMGGAIGNLIDRVVLGSVVDFLAFQLGSYHWPDFNIADSAIVIGSLLLISELLLPTAKSAVPEP